MGGVYCTPQKNSGEGGSTQFYTDIFNVPVQGATQFNLSNVPTAPTNTWMTVNGVEYIYGTDYSVAANVLTWLDRLFILDATDDLIVHYY